MIEWINIKERVPTEDDKYLVCVTTLGEPYLAVAWFDPNFGWSLLMPEYIPYISHWAHLTVPPDLEDIK